MSLVYWNEKERRYERIKLSKEDVNIVGRMGWELYLIQVSPEDLSEYRRKIPLGRIDLTVSRYSPEINKFGTAMIKYDPKSKKYLLTTSPNSTNLVKLSGEKVSEYKWKKLKDGDEIIVGSSYFIFFEE